MADDIRIDLGLEDLNKGVRSFEQMLAISEQIESNLKLEIGPQGLKARVGAVKQLATESDKLRASTERLRQTDEKALKENIRVREVLNKRRAAIRDQVRVEEKLLSVYQVQSKRLVTLRNRYKDLALQNKTNTKEAKALLRELTTLDKKLKSVDKSVGQSQRNVGDYGKSLAGVRGGVTALVPALAGGAAAFLAVASVVGAAKETIVNFDESVADLAKTTGLSKEEARELAKEIIKIDTRTSVTNLLALASAAGRLGLEGEEIISFTEQVDKAFVALGDSLEGDAEEIGLTLGKLASNFNLEEKFGIGEAINKVGSALNELGANSKATEGPIVDFTKRLSGIASEADLTIPQVTALGALFDETGQSIEVSASTLSKLLPALGKDTAKFAEVAGVSIEEFEKTVREDAFEALKLVATGAKSNEKGLIGLTETLEGYGIKSARAAGIAGVLSNNVDRLTELQVIANDAFEEGTSLADEFATKNNTLAAASEKMDNAFDRAVLSIEDGSGIISEGLTSITKGMTNWLNQIAVLGDTDFEGAFGGFVGGIFEAQEALSAISGQAFPESIKVMTDLVNLAKSSGVPLKVLEEGMRAIQDLSIVELSDAEVLAALTKRIDEYGKGTEEAAEKTKDFEGTLDDVAEALSLDTLKAIKEQIKVLKEQREVTKIGTDAYGELNKEIKRLEGLLPKSGKKAKESATGFAALQEQISKLKKEVEIQILNGNVNQESLSELKRLTDELTEAQKELNIALGQEPEELKNIRKDREKSEKESLKIAEQEAKAKQGLRESELNDIIDSEKSTEEARIQAAMSLKDLIIENTDLTESERQQIIRDSEKKITEIQLEESEKRAQADEEARVARLEKINERLGQIGDLANSIGGIISGLRERELQEIDSVQQAEEEKLQESLDNKLITEEEFEAQSQILAEESDAKRSELLKKQAQTDKALALFNATIQGAQSVVAALTIPPPAGPILAAINATLAAAQVAAIAAKPIPQFAEGTDFLDDPNAPHGKDKILMYGDKGEAIITKDRNKQYSGLSKAFNDGSVEDWVHDSGMLKAMTDQKEMAFADRLAKSMVLHAKLNDGNILEALHRMQEADGKNTKSIVGAMKIKRKDLRSLN